MKIEVICETCSTEDYQKIMNLEGSLYTNSESLTQAQRYKCGGCDNEITVIVYVEDKLSEKEDMFYKSLIKTQKL